MRGRRRAMLVAAICLIAAFASGCASAPPTHWYTLASVAPAGPASATDDVSVVVGPVSIPARVDMPQIVVRIAPNQVSQDEFHRWASPLQDEISQAVAANLAATLATAHVSLAQQALDADPDFRVAIEILEFESAPGEATVLDAAWTVRRTGNGTVRTGRTTVRQPLAEAGFDALAAAHGRAIARLSREIAGAIRSLEETPH
jgi:uncharacterized lipoprotein YmbA